MHIYFWALSAEQTWKHPEAVSTLSAQILVSNAISSKRSQGSLEKWPVLGLGQEIYKMNLEYLVMPDPKEAFIRNSH